MTSEQLKIAVNASVWLAMVTEINRRVKYDIVRQRKDWVSVSLDYQLWRRTARDINRILWTHIAVQGMSLLDLRIAQLGLVQIQSRRINAFE